MSEVEFAERIAKVRARFVTKFANKLQETDAVLAHLGGDGAEAATATEATYRRFHDMCGIGSTIGFVATGEAARTLDAILIVPFRARRGLSADELARFKDGVETLRTVGLSEIEAMAANKGSAT